MCPEVQDPKKKAEILPAIYQERRDELITLLEGAIDAKKWESYVLMALRNPSIGEKCSRASIITALLTNARLALPLDGVHSVLVPFAGVCTHIVGYPGWVSLYVRHADASHVDPVVVFEGDPFKVFAGSDDRIEHEQLRTTKRTDPEKIVATYCIVHLKNGQKKSWICWRDELDEIRRKALAKAGGKQSVYDGGNTLIEMWRKAPIIRVRKGLNIAPRIQAILAEIEKEELDPKTIDIAGENVTQASSIDELLAARKASGANPETGEIEKEPEPSPAVSDVREIYGIPVEYDWDSVKDEAFGGRNGVLAKMTPAQLVEALIAKNKEATEAANTLLKRGQEIFAEGKTPAKPYQVLALAFHYAELGAGF